ncbi:MAG: AEC family transporter, partial [Cellvibrionaceae bacterium]|nr:AEC family transporter [Cellvibrionaceae bacterium]
MWQSLQFALGVTSPVFVLIFLGYGLKRWGWVSAQFVGEASALIFKLFLPCLLFFTIIKLDLVQLFQPRLLGLMLLITLFAYLLLEWFSARINS